MTKCITDIDGVYAAGIHCGIKAKKKDLAFIYVPECYSAAGVGTTNAFAAPCITQLRERLKQNSLKAILINSGNANVLTGKEGEKNSDTLAEKFAQTLGLDVNEVLTASTGITGKQLPMDAILSGIETLCSDPLQKNGKDAAEAILTSDLVVKEQYAEKTINGVTYRAAGNRKRLRDDCTKHGDDARLCRD